MLIMILIVSADKLWSALFKAWKTALLPEVFVVKSKEREKAQSFKNEREVCTYEESELLSSPCYDWLPEVNDKSHEIA